MSSLYSIQFVTPNRERVGPYLLRSSDSAGSQPNTTLSGNEKTQNALLQARKDMEPPPETLHPPAYTEKPAPRSSRRSRSLQKSGLPVHGCGGSHPRPINTNATQTVAENQETESNPGSPNDSSELSLASSRFPLPDHWLGPGKKDAHPHWQDSRVRAMAGVKQTLFVFLCTTALCYADLKHICHAICFHPENHDETRWNKLTRQIRNAMQGVVLWVR